MSVLRELSHLPPWHYPPRYAVLRYVPLQGLVVEVAAGSIEACKAAERLLCPAEDMTTDRPLKGHAGRR